MLGEWLDRPITADLTTAIAADRLGYEQVWIGEMAKVDAPTLAAMVVARTERIEPVIGPLAVTVRSPVQIAIAAQTIGAGDRPVHVALGTSSKVVARWHDRSRAGAATKLDTSRRDLAALFAGERIGGFRLSEPPEPVPSITVAAFGPRAVAVARAADRMVLNMVTVEAARRLARHHPNTAIWLAAAVDPTDEERSWLSRGYVGYLAAPGYAEMFIEAGFGELVEFARSRPGPKAVFSRMPDDLIDHVALVGDEATVQRRIDEYAAAGITEIGIVAPPEDLRTGPRTLEALAPGRATSLP